MEKVKTNTTLEGAGVICLSIGTALLGAGKYLEGSALVIVGAALFYLKYTIRDR